MPDEVTVETPLLGEAGASAPGASAVPRSVARRLFLSHALTKFGSRAWEFATPLLLLQWSPGSLVAPAAFGMAVMLSRVLLSPLLGARADGWDRMSAMVIGSAMQAVGCIVPIVALIWRLQLGGGDAGGVDGAQGISLLALVVLGGCVEALGSSLAAVSVKKEWVPVIYDGAAASQLTSVNTTMSNIDLFADMLAPLLAGLVLQLSSADGTDVSTGFAVVAGANVLSLLPQVLLLRGVYRGFEGLRARAALRNGGGADGAGGVDGASAVEGDAHGAWAQWAQHPSGLPLITLSYALLYFTALAPHGIVFTAYMTVHGTSPTTIGVFRCCAAAAGVIGVTAFAACRRRPTEADEDVGERFVIPDLRRLNVRFVGIQAASVLVAALAFTLQDGDMAAGPFGQEVAMGAVLGAEPLGFLLFCGAVVLSRVGLYGFDVGLLELEQLIVDERYRSAAGSVEAALCAVAELGVYAMSIAFPRPEDFFIQVWASAGCVTAAALCYSAWMATYHSHEHVHAPGEPGREHKHTMQQLRTMQRGGGVHTHVHPREGQPDAGHRRGHDHGHGHDHRYGHGHRHGHEHRHGDGQRPE